MALKAICRTEWAALVRSSRGSDGHISRLGPCGGQQARNLAQLRFLHWACTFLLFVSTIAALSRPLNRHLPGASLLNPVPDLPRSS
jgi:hypothetical protein